ncbi:MAG: zinc ABC transporter substrate-binding protein [Candidatus Odinarchaeota archaeon]|nr:zinc ABC transporter substrate-binding protein [Candidatus Odinarchaeota archaeon]
MRKKFFTVLMFFMLVAAVLMPIQTTVAGNVYAQVISTNDSKPLVVCTTSVLASIVEDLADGDVEVKYLVSPSMCPGHYDVKPGDVETIRNASLILAHGMEWSGWLRELINSANQTGDLHVPIYNITGPWNTPPMLKQKYQTVASKLSEALGLNVSSKLSKCLDAIDQVDAELKSMVDKYGFNGTPVACMLWQKGFVEYLGFKVVATYGPTEYLSQSDIEEIETNITTYGARLIIDNLHSGIEVGRKIAEDTGIVQVVLINFPGSVVGINNVTEMMLYNAEMLADGLKYYEYKVELESYKSAVSFWQYATIGVVLLAVIEAVIIVLLVVRAKKHE